MESWDDRNGVPRGHGPARHVSPAVAERESGRRRLNTTTSTFGVSSLLTAGAVAWWAHIEHHDHLWRRRQPGPGGRGGRRAARLDEQGIDAVERLHLQHR